MCVCVSALSTLSLKLENIFPKALTETVPSFFAANLKCWRNDTNAVPKNEKMIVVWKMFDQLIFLFSYACPHYSFSRFNYLLSLIEKLKSKKCFELNYEIKL